MEFRRHARAPQVGAAMTPFPHFVSVDDSVEKVARLMRENGIRHVPVQDGGEVVGIISERDLHRLVNPSLPAPNRARIRARAVLLPNPYVIEVNAPLARVVSEMAERQIGSAIVVKHGKLAGILSVTDVCRVLGELLEEIFPSSDGNAA
jgi:acetoin utilization protein AcuB